MKISSHDDLDEGELLSFLPSTDGLRHANVIDSICFHSCLRCSESCCCISFA